MSKWTGDPEPRDQNYLHCGLVSGGGDTICWNPARYQGDFLVGAWQALVPLCEEHVRNFVFLIRAGTGGKGVAAATMTMEVHLGPKVFELRTGEEYKLPQQVYTCSECGSKIVRSFETGKWLVIPDLEVDEVSLTTPAAAIAHEHIPG